MLLFVAVISLGVGILIGRYQPATKSGEAATAGTVERLPEGTETAKREPESRPKNENVVTEGVQISPAPVVMPNSQSSGNAQASRPVTQREPNSQFVPAPPPRRKDSEEAQPDADAMKVAQSTDKPAPASTPAAPTPTVGASMPVSPVEDIEEPATPAAAPDAESTPAARAVPQGGFTVQVGSFDTQANAERFKKLIEEKSDYEVALYPAKDGKVIKACIGSYPDEASARKAREQLGRINDFKGCFVKPVSEL